LLVRAPAAAALCSGWLTTSRAAAAVKNPVACQTNAWQITPGNFNELLDRVTDLQRLGFEAFECNVRFVKDQFATSNEARARIEKTGVRFYGPHVGLGLPMSDLQAWVGGAATLGASRFALSGAGKPLTGDGRLDRDALRAKVDAINTLGQHCQRAGLRLVYHNHRTEFTDRAAEMEYLLEQTDPALVWLLLDTGHAWLEKTDLPAFLTRHHARIDALHIRGIKGGKQVPLSEGEIDQGALAASIRRTNWPGYLTLEEEALKSKDNQFVESVLRSSREIIRREFGV
jgi:sugar phosphate isomerase/epimerase